MNGSYGTHSSKGWDMKSASFGVSCAFTGLNPGQVKVECQVQEGGWARNYRPAGQGVVGPDSRFSTGSVSGRLEALPWDDFQMVITGVDAHPYSSTWATFSGEAKGYLNPA